MCHKWCRRKEKEAPCRTQGGSSFKAIWASFVHLSWSILWLQQKVVSLLILWLLLRYLWKRREVVLELQWFQEQWDLCFTSHRCHHASHQLSKDQSQPPRDMPPPIDVPLPTDMLHPHGAPLPHWHTTTPADVPCHPPPHWCCHGSTTPCTV